MDPTGTLLASVTFAGETASGWQQATFSSPVAITANTTYVVSYQAPNGFYSANGSYFTPGGQPAPARPGQRHRRHQRRLPATAPAAFPGNSFNDTNYWVDVVFVATTGYTPRCFVRGAGAGATGVAVAPSPAATFDQAVTASVDGVHAEGCRQHGGDRVDQIRQRHGDLHPGGCPGEQHDVHGHGQRGHERCGPDMAAPYSWTFTTTAAQAGCPCSVFSATSVPSTVTVNDANAVELGMKFRSDVAGTVTGVRFYKGSSNTGTHTGHLWSASGTLLASVTFSGETASGWQQATFSSPVAITANTTYVVSYQAPNGFYSANGGYFSSAADTPPLHGLASGTDGSNGVYSYGATAFPNNSYNNTNYWVDVIFNAGG